MFAGSVRTATSYDGSAVIAMTSASYPTSNSPDFGACGPSVCGAVAVAASIACSGDMPALTRWTSSAAFSPQCAGSASLLAAMSVPIATVTPDDTAICSASACRSAKLRSFAIAYGGTVPVSPKSSMSATIVRVGTRIAPLSRIIAAHSSSR